MEVQSISIFQLSPAHLLGELKAPQILLLNS